MGTDRLPHCTRAPDGSMLTCDLNDMSAPWSVMLLLVDTEPGEHARKTKVSKSGSRSRAIAADGALNLVVCFSKDWDGCGCVCFSRWQLVVPLILYSKVALPTRFS
jgi:RNA polymerase subunit RPABC4/transcription elongation factor Spt4